MSEKATQVRGRKTRASSRRSIMARQKSQEAVRLRQAGATMQQIATQLGYANESGAYKAVMRELEATATDQSEGTEAVRQLELNRLDQMLFVLYPQILRGDQGAIATALRVEERRANLLGLDAPKQFEHRMQVNVVSWNEAIRDFLELYREIHGNPPEARILLSRIDKLGEEKFAGVS
jgi:hypothetical protein